MYCVCEPWAPATDVTGTVCAVNDDKRTQTTKIARSKKSWLNRHLSKRHGYVCADAELIPLQENSVDLVFSNLTIQWCNDIEQTFEDGIVHSFILSRTNIISSKVNLNAS